MFRLNDEVITRVEELYEEAMQELDETDYRIAKIWSEADDEEHTPYELFCLLEPGEGVEEIFQGMLEDNGCGDGDLMLKNLMMKKTTPETEVEDRDNWGWPYYALKATMGEEKQNAYVLILPCLDPTIYPGVEFDFLVLKANKDARVEGGSVTRNREPATPKKMLDTIVRILKLEDVRILDGYERVLVESLFKGEPSRKKLAS